MLHMLMRMIGINDCDSTHNYGVPSQNLTIIYHCGLKSRKIQPDVCEVSTAGYPVHTDTQQTQNGIGKLPYHLKTCH